MTESNQVLGIDLGTAKSGLCWIDGNKVVALTTCSASELVNQLEMISKDRGFPSAVVVDVPIDPTAAAGFRLTDRVFVRGLFNNNHVGLQPNNPDLLNLAATFEPLREWCISHGIRYSNEFPGPKAGVLRETMPNVALGMLSSPSDLLIIKKKLRFRYGRGSNVAPVVVCFECLQPKHSFFAPVVNAPDSWDALLEVASTATNSQSDDLIAALTCAMLAWWCCNSNEISYVHEARGHYLLPPRTAIHSKWHKELLRILGDDDFADVKTNLRDLPAGRQATV